MKQVQQVFPAQGRHWVGDGFPVHSLFGYEGNGAQARSPFLLLDYASPFPFAPTTSRRGVGAHPHRGFETVTLVFSGEVEHHDSTGHGGKIGPGDVQWMTAGGGIVHQEYHSKQFAREGGSFEVAQLWVNLPAKDKMTTPGYQAITAKQIPEVALAGDGRARVIAGRYVEAQGPAQTYTPMLVLDAYLQAGQGDTMTVPAGWTTLVVVLSGALTVQGQRLGPRMVAHLEPEGDQFQVRAEETAHFLVLSGEPLDEPIVGHGPFVMNTTGEIEQAFSDLQSGQFARKQTSHQET